MRVILALLVILGLAFLIQTTIVSRINLLSGCADLVLVILAAWSLQERVRFAWILGAVAGFLAGGISATPWYLYVSTYLVVVGLSRLLTRRIWQAPLLAMFAVTFTGTLLFQMVTYIYRTIFETPLLFGTISSQVILPSLLMNLFLSIIIYPIVRDLATWIYPGTATA